MAQLRAEFEASGKIDRFTELKGALTVEPEASSYAEAGGRLGMTESAVKSAVHRLRQRFGDLLRAEISETVADPGDVDQEMRYLVAALSS